MNPLKAMDLRVSHTYQVLSSIEELDGWATSNICGIIYKRTIVQRIVDIIISINVHLTGINNKRTIVKHASSYVASLPTTTSHIHKIISSIVTGCLPIYRFISASNKAVRLDIFQYATKPLKQCIFHI